MINKPLLLRQNLPLVDSLIHSKLLRWLAALAYTALLTLVLVQPSGNPIVGPAAPPGPPDLMREIYLTAGHIIGFSALTLLWWWAFQATLPFRRALLLAVLIAVILGVVTEFAQSFVPDRSASLIDMAANTAAALGMAWIIRHFHS